MRRRPRHKKPLRQTLRKWGQPPSSWHVSRRQPRIKISARRRTRAIPTARQSIHSTRPKAQALRKVKACKESGQQKRELETSLGIYPSVRAREQLAPERRETNRGISANVA